MWKTLTSLAIWGPGWGGGVGFNNQTGPIYPLFYINLHVKHRSNMIKTFFEFKKKMGGSCWALT